MRGWTRVPVHSRPASNRSTADGQSQRAAGAPPTIGGLLSPARADMGAPSPAAAATAKRAGERARTMMDGPRARPDQPIVGRSQVAAGEKNVVAESSSGERP